MLTYKRKLKLSKAQEDRLSSWIGTCRFVYNMGMQIKKEAWKNKQINVSSFDLMKQLTEIKDYDWISDVPSQSLQNSLEQLGKSYKNFFRTFKTGGGFPKFKSKRGCNSILFKQGDLKRVHPSIELTSKQTINFLRLVNLNFLKTNH